MSTSTNPDGDSDSKSAAATESAATDKAPGATSFADLNLPDSINKALAVVGYETPSAIQSAIIPIMLEGADVLGQAQTGTGKTAAFALPLLAKLDLNRRKPQVLVLAPTRELAIQVAEAFQKYASHIKGFRVLPVYGGTDYRQQLRQLERGAQVVVGTPGRVMDHIRRGTMDLSELKTLVLDEADEMLRMGFIDDVEWILEQTPAERQTALFSATMPDAIRRIARNHLKQPREVKIKVKTVTNESIRQRVWMMAGMHKLDALTRILEVQDFDGVIVFVRTRIATVEVADKLLARGYSAAALNGDIPQKQREVTIEKLKAAKLDILVATDVAARGLDVDRISHVINYDIPHDVEAYIHRIGRTGRAGRTGEAILFAANRERRLLKAIERATGQVIEKMELPSVEEVTDKRIDRFKQRVTETLATDDLAVFRRLIEEYQHEHGVPVIDIAAALGAMAQGAKPLVARAEKAEKAAKFRDDSPRKPARAGRGADRSEGRREGRSEGRNEGRHERNHEGKRDTERSSASASRSGGMPDVGLQRYRIEVGHSHGVKPGNIVGAIANEAEIESEYIGRVDIHDDYSLVDLPEGMPKEIFKHLKTVWVSGQRLQISLDTGSGSAPAKVKKSKQRKPNSPGAQGAKRAGKSGAKKN